MAGRKKKPKTGPAAEQAMTTAEATVDARHLRVADLWNWLPAFRVVAETGQVHAAARRLHVSPSAVSRTVKLLESRVGGPLFEREERGMKLTVLGSELVAATRSAMRLIDDTLEAQPLLRVSSAGRLTMAYLSPALSRIRKAQPRLVVSVSSVPAASALEQLLRGSLDLAVVVRGFSHPELTVTRLGAATSSVYCGRAHPLFNVRAPRVELIARYPFAGPHVEAGQPSLDGWPPDVPRRVMLQSSILDGALEACASGELLAVLPDHVVATLSGGARLRPLTVSLIEPMDLFAIRRTAASGRTGLAESLVAELRREIDRSRGERAG